MENRRFMNRNIVRIITVFVVLTLAATLSQAQEKTVEQVKKNIQVLKGMPASQLSMVMDMFASSLGVRCNHCHVNGAFDSDDKKEKKTAREMIQMVMNVNATTFHGEKRVTCYTCHLGTTDPARTVSLPVMMAAHREDEEEKRPELPTVQAVLAKYENALGGADAIAKIQSRHTKVVSVDSRGDEHPAEVYQKGPDKITETMPMEDGSSFSHGYDGTKGWMASKRGTREVPAMEVVMMQREAPLFPLTRLKMLADSAGVHRIDTVNGSQAYAMFIRNGTGQRERYYFDTATGLLLRRVVMTPTMMGDYPERTDYGDYRTVDGVKVPYLMHNCSADAQDNSTDKVTLLEQNVSVDDSKFSMPADNKK
jgi:hypothetical protein